MTDEYFMMQAIKEAKRAFDDEEIPVGAIVIMNGKIIARGYNMTERLKDPTAHAEMSVTGVVPTGRSCLSSPQFLLMCQLTPL